MRTIYKYDVPLTNEVGIEIPGFIQWLHVGVQYDVAVVWAVVDTDKPMANQRLHVRGTGHPMTGEEGEHVGSIQLHGGALVFHVFADFTR